MTPVYLASLAARPCHQAADCPTLTGCLLSVVKEPQNPCPRSLCVKMNVMIRNHGISTVVGHLPKGPLGLGRAHLLIHGNNQF